MLLEELKKKIRMEVVKIDSKEIGIPTEMLNVLRSAMIQLSYDAATMMAVSAKRKNLEMASCLENLAKEIKQYHFEVLESAFKKGKYLILAASDLGHKEAMHFVENSLLSDDKSSDNESFDIIEFAEEVEDEDEDDEEEEEDEDEEDEDEEDEGDEDDIDLT